MKTPRRQTALWGTLLFAGLADAGIARAATRDWQDLALSETYVLDQDLALSTPRGRRIDVPEGARYSLDEVVPLEGLSVVQYGFAAETCADPAETSEMELVLPEASEPGSNAEVGVQLVADCRLEVFVEAKDLGRASFYREP